MDQLATAGRFLTQQAVPRAEQGLGLGLDLIETLRSLEKPGGLLRQEILRARALQDPATREEILRSPFLAGQLGLGLRTTEGARPSEGGPGAPTLIANLPPLSTTQQANEALARAEERMILADPTSVAAHALGLPPSSAQISQAVETLPPNARLSVPLAGGMRETFGTTPSKVYPTLEAAMQASTMAQRFGLRTAPLQAPGGGFTLRVLPSEGQFAGPVVVGQPSGQVPITGGPPGGPSAQPEAAPQPSQPIVVPPGFKPLPGTEGIVAPSQQQAGFPPGAPGPGMAQNIPAVPPATLPSLTVGGQPLRPPGRGEHVTVKERPGVTRTIAGPSGREDFAQVASQRALPLLFHAKTAIARLKEKGILTDDPQGILLNRARLEVESRKPQADQDAVFLVRNLRSAVPLLARGFGEQRTNQREEQRLVEALSFSFMSSSAAEAIIDNYIELFTTGDSPALQALAPQYTNIISNAYRQSLTPGQQRVLKQSKPLSP